MHAARQTRIEAPYSAHDVNALELLGAIFLKDRSVLYSILIRSRRSVDIPRIRVPGCGRIGMVISDFAFANHHVVREHTSYGLVEAATDSLLGNLEVGPGSGPAGVQLLQRPLSKIESRRRCVDLEVSSGAITLDGIAPLRNLPFKLNLRLGGSLGQVHLHAVTRGFDVTDIHEPGERRRPKSGNRSATGVQCEMVICTLI